MAAADGGSGQSTFIATGVKFKGEISGKGDVVIDGEFEGRLNMQSAVTISSDGRVSGDIDAESVKVSGKVFGNVKASDRFEIDTSGRIEGDVSAPRVIIAEGAFFKGNVEMTGGQKAEEATPRIGGPERAAQ